MASPSVHTISKLYFSFFQLKRMKLFTFYIGISASLSQTIIGKDLHEIFLKGENLSFRSKIGYFIWNCPKAFSVRGSLFVGSKGYSWWVSMCKICWKRKRKTVIPMISLSKLKVAILQQSESLKNVALIMSKKFFQITFISRLDTNFWNFEIFWHGLRILKIRIIL